MRHTRWPTRRPRRSSRAFRIATTILLPLMIVQPFAVAVETDHHCFGEEATIVGTNNGEELTGTPGDDVMVGLEGSDEIRGQGGNDLICGGRGRDHVVGAFGNDRLNGGPGPERCPGLEEECFVDGGPGDDWLRGGPGPDNLSGKEGMTSSLGTAKATVLQGATVTTC